MLKIETNTGTDYSGSVGVYGNFDDLYDKLSAEGGIDSITPEAWEGMLKRWSARSQVKLTGSTALIGTLYAEQAAISAEDTEAFEDGLNAKYFAEAAHAEVAELQAGNKENQPLPTSN